MWMVTGPEDVQGKVCIVIHSALLKYRMLLFNDVHSGAVKVCSKDDRPLSTNQGARAQSSCSNGGGPGYLCSDYSPKPVADGLSYGFAVTNGSENCCKCFELLWTDGEGAGKRVQLQVINTGGTLENGREFVILTPGGGVGPNPSGCSNQYGDIWSVCVFV